MRSASATSVARFLTAASANVAYRGRPTRAPDCVGRFEAGTSTEPLQTLVEVEGVSGGWSYAGSGSLHRRLAPTDGLQLTVLHLDDEPVAVAERLRVPLTERWRSPTVTSLLAAPFVPVVPFAWDAALPWPVAQPPELHPLHPVGREHGADPRVPRKWSGRSLSSRASIGRSRGAAETASDQI